MTAQTVLPENVTEVGSIHVSVALGMEGSGCAFDLEGLSDEQAIGYLTTVVDQLRQRVANRWAASNGSDTMPIESWNVICPHCENYVEVDPNAEYAEDQE